MITTLVNPPPAAADMTANVVTQPSMPPRDRVAEVAVPYLFGEPSAYRVRIVAVLETLGAGDDLLHGASISWSTLRPSASPIPPRASPRCAGTGYAKQEAR
jgi:hypothetical protein